MTQLVLGRLARFVGVWLGVLTRSFALRPLAPGDPIDALLYGQPSNPQTVAAPHIRFGLDRPLHKQYLAYLGGVVRGDLGTSFVTQRRVGEEIGDHFWKTLHDTTYAVVIGREFWRACSPQEPFITSYRGCRGTIAGIGPLQMF